MASTHSEKYISVNIDYIGMFDRDTLAPCLSLHYCPLSMCNVALLYEWVLMNKWSLDGLAPVVKQSIKLMTHVSDSRLRQCGTIPLPLDISVWHDSWALRQFLCLVLLVLFKRYQHELHFQSDHTYHDTKWRFFTQLCFTLKTENASKWEGIATGEMHFLYTILFHVSKLSKIKSYGMLHCIDC